MKKYILVNNRDYFREANGPKINIYNDVIELYRKHFQDVDFGGEDFESCLLNYGIEGIIDYIQDTFPNSQSSISIWEIDVETNESKLLYS